MSNTILHKLVELLDSEGVENLTYSDFINPYFIQELEDLLDRYEELPESLSSKLIDLKLSFVEM